MRILYHIHPLISFAIANFSQRAFRNGTVLSQSCGREVERCRRIPYPQRLAAWRGNACPSDQEFLTSQTFVIILTTLSIVHLRPHHHPRRNRTRSARDRPPCRSHPAVSQLSDKAARAYFRIQQRKRRTVLLPQAVADQINTDSKSAAEILTERPLLSNGSIPLYSPSTAT